MAKNSDDTGRFGGPGSSHQDREHPGKNGQVTGHKGGGAQAGHTEAGQPTNTSHSRQSGGGGERDTHHTHDPKTKS